MSKFSWRNGFAVGLVAGISATVFFSILLETYPAKIPPQDTYADEARSISPEDNRWWLIWRVAYMEDTLAQWLMTVLTLFAVVLVYLTLRDTRRIALDQSRIGEAQVRAYMSCEKVTCRPAGTSESADAFTLHVKFKNLGTSPAQKFRLYLTITLLDKNGAEVLPPIHAPPSPERDLPPQFSDNALMGFGIPKGMGARVLASELRLRFDVKITYFDVFDMAHTAESRHFIDGSLLETGLTVMPYDERNNGA